MKKATRLLTPALGVGLVFGAMGVSAQSETVTVESGDTYWGIAQGFDGVTTEDLVEANEYNPRAIPIGAEIKIPDGETSSDNDVVTHVIQPGNTLTNIAAVYDGVTVDDLFRLNPGIDPYSLTVGSEIVVVDYNSEFGEDYLYHTVQPGNTFNEIASVYDGVTVDDLLEANPNEDPYELTIGSRIVIPLN
ncbi:LysM peptidoglycan-binding domain-containing protein [Anaerobacillus isosaccharinicus]|uniref:LysM peptidoglycan-binding domain-containing protein n=1 Tax=Anaerobacillus isosaccharinicus TaxID=1532552 RepID=A0A7S7L915_9BACI|nr:LysM peptidoglycan-binding domain-containing protein [Anaerobacillus isosaccharinicus]MBA5585073.1 LysM peptidoglycan-binding domain-containing protein [Anaerobacillus isosaccharinicus]QOY36582.1 LysM peptidoglycan-binding domain-containing protein [Anaerobacillus isosaccharinicus]